jgi:hypothetical protein
MNGAIMYLTRALAHRFFMLTSDFLFSVGSSFVATGMF